MVLRDKFRYSRGALARALRDHLCSLLLLQAIACATLAAPATALAQATTDPKPARSAEPMAPDEALVPWFGFALSCSECTIETPEMGLPGKWTFSSPPTVYLVEPTGPADRAGLRKGDVLTHVGGSLITSVVARRTLNGTSPADTLHLQFLRDGERAEASLVVGTRSLRSVRAIARAAAEMRRAEDVAAGPTATADETGLRYAGTLGSVAIDVSSSDAVIVDELPNAVVIRASGIVVRLVNRCRGCQTAEDR